VQNSPLLPQHQAAGGRLAGDVLLTYGDVPVEYQAAHEGAALFDVASRGAVEVVGPEAEAFLHRLTANAVKGLPIGGGNASLLLTGKGKVQQTFELDRSEQERYRLSTGPGCAEPLRAALDMYHFAEELELRDATDEHAPLELCGPDSIAIAEAVLGAPLPEELHTHVELDGVRAARLPVAGHGGVRLDPGAGGVVSLWARLVEAGARPAGMVVRDSLRAEAGAAEWGRDVDENVYPQEARLDAAFSLEKGCYVGQEVVAKIDTYGGLNKRLELLRVDHDDPVTPGTRLMRQDGGEWRDLGVTTTWAYSFALDGGVVLGYVKRKHQQEGTTFRLGDGPGTATIVEFPAG
jgi:folate-binding protein YgfZ